MIYTIEKKLYVLTLSQTTNLSLSKLTDFADNNFKFDRNGNEFSKQVENTVGKGEIACYVQYPFPHSVFKRLILQIPKNQGLFWKSQILDSKQKGFADDSFNFHEIGRKFFKIACYEQFLLFQQFLQKTYTADIRKQGLV